MVRDERIRWPGDTSPASWVGLRLHPFNQDTGSIVPEGFEAYCRVFHPDGPLFADGSFRSWTEIAKNNGRIAHRNMQFHMIDRPMGSPVPDRMHEGSGPSTGTLPPMELQRLVEVLRLETGTPDRCWFCIWEGYGNIEIGDAALVQHTARNYGLYPGPIDLAMAPLDVDTADRQSPNLWWPEDQAWIVATGIDFAWTYVGDQRS